MYPAKPSCRILLATAFRIALVCLVFSVLPLVVTAATINVPSDSATIQSAILGALPGDTVLIAAGTYHENINFLGKGITLRSSAGRETTIIHGDSINPVVLFDSAEDTTAHLQNLTIRSGGSANIVCTGASPTIHDCRIDSSSVGILLTSSEAIITQCDIVLNASDGIRMTGSFITVSTCNLSDNGGAGIHGDNVKVFLTNTMRRNGTYPLVLGAPSIGRLASGSQFLLNGIQAFGVLGGTLADSAVWKPIGGIARFVILGSGDLSVVGPSSPVLALDPGVRLEFTTTTGTLSVGSGGSGALVADAPSSNPVTFVPHASINAWRGIRFESGSKDDICVLRNCIIRRSQGLVCSFSSPAIDSCRIDSCNGDGLTLTGSQAMIANSVIADNSGVGIRLSSSQVTVTGCEITGNGSYGVYGSTLTVFSGNTLANNTAAPLAVGPNSVGRIDGDNSFAGNGDPSIIVLPGAISETSTWRTFPGLDRYTLAVTASVNVQGAASPVLTLMPGVRLEFGHPSYGLVIGAGAPGALIAEGESAAPVMLRPGEAVSSWLGLTFGPYAIDSLCRVQHTVIRRAQTVSCTDASPLFDSCRIDSCLGDGLSLVNSEARLTFCTFADNGGDGISISGLGPDIIGCTITGNTAHGIYGGPLATCSANTIGDNVGYPVLLVPNSISKISSDNIFTGQNQTIAVLGGVISESATWNVLPNVGRYLMATSGIIYIQGAASPILTLAPGVRLEFASPSFGLRIGYTASGGLRADASGGDAIVMTNDPGLTYWAGLQFGNLTVDTASSLKNCVIRRARSVYVTDASPAIHDCVIDRCTESGLTLTNSASRILRCTITDNAVHGVSLSNATPYLANCFVNRNGQCGLYCANESRPVVGSSSAATCNLSYNGTYALYNNGTQSIFARNNAWGADDSTGVAALIWDTHDDSTKGLVEFMPFVLGYVCGDVNGDGTEHPAVNDLTYLIAFLFRGGPPPPEPGAADVNNDGFVKISDLAYLVAYLFRGGPAPVCGDLIPR